MSKYLKFLIYVQVFVEKYNYIVYIANWNETNRRVTIMTNIEDNIFLEEILKLLEPMGKVDMLRDGDIVDLIKDKIVFAKIMNSQVYLKAKNNQYVVVPPHIIKTEDLFLVQATRSYWLSREQAALVTS
ncbi:MAG: hypothetical protein HRU35_06725 [Rickettsiaceae bacterium]|nr:hypothetical protein [Rickettsiaceae bacterium]